MITELVQVPGGGGGGEAIITMDYTGRLRPKRIPFSSWRYIKGRDFTI